MSGQSFGAKELLARLVAFDTTSSKSNMALITFVQDYLSGHGVACTLVPEAGGKKANLFATIGPDRPGGIGLSGHTDVVPVDDQNWDTDPFEMVEKDGRLFGRGTSDMKGFIAVALAHVPAFLSRDLARPIHLLFSYDEEIGCTGVRPMIAKLGDSLPMPEMIVVGEPTNMAVVDAHKSIHAYETEVRGQAAHSSMTHLGVNAIMAAGELIGELNRIAVDMRDRAGGERFNPPYTTVHVGTITGGTALNIVPTRCRFAWEFRGLPDQDTSEIPDRLAAFARARLLPGMRKIMADADIVTRATNRVPGLTASRQSAAVSLALKLAGQNETFTVAYGTEAGLFEEGGAPAVVCGPGDIAQAHKPNEYIVASELVSCAHFMDRLLEHVAAP